MGPSLHYIELLILAEASLDVLWEAFINVFNQLPDRANLLHEFVPKGLVSDQPFTAVADSELLFLFNRVAVKQTCTCKTWEVLAV